MVSDGAEAAERRRLDALMYRMLGGVLLLGAGMLVVVLVVVLRLPRAMLDGQLMLVLPGLSGRHGLSPLALPILGGGALVMGLGGLAALALGRRQMRFGPGGRFERSPSAFRRPVLVLLAGVAVLLAVLLRR